MGAMATRAILALTLALQVSEAAAQNSVAVLGVEGVDAPESSAKLLTAALRDRVQQTSGYKLVAGKDVDEVKLVFGCVDERPDCMASAGRSLNATWLLWGILHQTKAGYRLTVKWLNVEDATIDSFVSETIGHAPISAAQAKAIIIRLTRPFLAPTTGSVRVECNVSDADVGLGALVAATTTDGVLLLDNVAEGTHVVQISKEGYATWNQQIVVQGGQTTSIRAELIALKLKDDPGNATPATQSPAPPDRNTGWKIAFWSSAALTLGLATGLGVSGWQVLRAQDDKKRAILDYRAEECIGDDCETALSGSNACSEADTLGVAGVLDACDRGEKFAIATNAFIAATGAAAVITGYLLYKAYLSSGTRATSADSKSADSEHSSAGSSRTATRWLLSPSIAPDSAGLGVAVQF